MKRTEVISFRLTEEEYSNLKKEAEEYKVGVNKYARLKVSNKEKVLCNSILLNNLLQLIGQIKRLGNNINQVSKYVNYYKQIDNIAAQELIKQLKQLQKLIEQIQNVVKELKRC